MGQIGDVSKLVSDMRRVGCGLTGMRGGLKAHEHIADQADGSQHFWLSRIQFKLAAKPYNQIIHRSILGAMTAPIDCLGYLLAADRHTGLAYKAGEQVKFCRGRRAACTIRAIDLTTRQAQLPAKPQFDQARSDAGC